MPIGRFITFEGGEGAGKSTQLRLLSDALDKAGVDHITTREPGGSDGAEEIRRLIVTGAADRWDATTETLLIMAARTHHWHHVVEPALRQGKWVLCDRFYDSTLVYQGGGKGVAREWLDTLYRLLFANLKPDVTFYLDIAPDVGLARTGARDNQGETRFESMDVSFHEVVRVQFQRIAAQEPQRVVTVDAAQSAEHVFAQMACRLNARYGLELPHE